MTITIRYFLFILFSSANEVFAQMCRDTSQYGQCSTNSECGCLPMIVAENSGLCGFLGISCSHFESCQTSDNDCEKPGHICVRHSRCSDRPVCYPLSMTHQELCPPTIKTNNTSTRMTTITTTTLSLSSTTDRNICKGATWARHGITIAGGNGNGSELNQLYSPQGLFVDENQMLYVVDLGNSRVVKWEQGASSGHIVAEGHKIGSNLNDLVLLSDVVVDKDETIYVTDMFKKRVFKWVRGANSGEVIMEISGGSQ